MTRLSRGTLDRLPADVARPGYHVRAARVGIVHLGIGAFHRAHQAVYVDDRLAAGERDWAICGASLRSPDTLDALEPQDGLYTVAIRSGEGERLRVVGAVRRLLVAPSDPEALLQAMSDAAVRIVSLTVTEKGYCHDPATGTLREDHPDIVADLRTPLAPRSAPGFLVEALRRRRDARASPFTVLCCDNLPANGRTVATVVRRLAELRDPTLGRWISDEVAFPSTMVDRIVPATTDADRQTIAARLGLEDAWPVMTEPFTQWVIEDRFANARPRLEEAGAELVADVAPYELMKLRLLNGSHSTLAYLGYLAGFEFVSGAISNTSFRALVTEFMSEEVMGTLPKDLGDLGAYRDALLDRFANPALKHRTWQIAMDGSQKLPQRLLGTIRDGLAQDRSIARAALGVAAWMRYVTGVDEQGREIDVRDPLASRLRTISASAGDKPAQLVDGLLGVSEVFGEDLPRSESFRAVLIRHLGSLFQRGALETVRELVKSET